MSSEVLASRVSQQKKQNNQGPLTPNPTQHPHRPPFPRNLCDMPTTLMCAWGLSTGSLTASQRFMGTRPGRG